MRSRAADGAGRRLRCSTTTSTSGRTTSTTRRCASSSWPTTASSAQAAGVTELALTEHLFRFRQADAAARRLLGRRAGAARAGRVHGGVLEVPRDRRPRRLRGVRPGGEGGGPARRHRPRGRLLRGPHGHGGRAAGRVSLRRPVGLGALGRGLALRRPRRPGVDGRVVGARRRRVLGGLHARARGAGCVRHLRRAGPPRPDQGGGPRARRTRRVVGPDGRGGGVVGHGGRAVLLGLAQARRGAVPGGPAARALRCPRGAAHHGLRRPPSRPRGRPGRRPARRAGVGGSRRSCRATGAGSPIPSRCRGRRRPAADADPRRARAEPHRPQARGARAPAAAARELERPGRPLLLRPPAARAGARRRH